MELEGLSLEIDTKGNGDTLNITDQISDLTGKARISDGIVIIFCPSSTSALTTLEYESGCVRDLQDYFERVSPANVEYQHNLRWNDGNGYSHLRAALLGPSLTIPIQRGCLTLGQWQQIILVDFDNRPRHRKLVVQIIGE